MCQHAKEPCLVFTHVNVRPPLPPMRQKTFQGMTIDPFSRLPRCIQALYLQQINQLNSVLSGPTVPCILCKWVC